MGRKRFVARLFDVLEGKTDEAAICWRASLHAREPGAEDDPSLDATLAAPPHAVVVRSKQRLVANVLPMLSCSANFDNFRRQCVSQRGAAIEPRRVARPHLASCRPRRAGSATTASRASVGPASSHSCTAPFAQAAPTC